MLHQPWIRTLALGFFSVAAGSASADVTFSISDLFGTNGPSGAEVIRAGGSFAKMTDQARYQFLWNYCRGYANDLSANAAAQTDCTTLGISPCDCGNVKVMGTVERTGVPDSLGSMNKFVVLPANGARRIGALNVSDTGIVSVPAGSLGTTECGIVNLSYYRGSAASPFSRCDSTRVVCGSDVLSPPSVGSAAPNCAPIALVAGSGGGGGGGGACSGTTANASECTANTVNYCPGQTVIDNCNRACASSYVGTKSTGCGGGNPSQMLVGGVHSVADCTAAGGTVVYETTSGVYIGTGGSMPANLGFCKFNGVATCPSGSAWWSKYRDYRATSVVFHRASKMAAPNAQQYNDGCSIPQWSNFIGGNLLVRDSWQYASSTDGDGDPFRNGPRDQVTMPAYSYFYTSCDGSEPNPAPAPPPIQMVAYGFPDRCLRDIRRGIDTLFDALFPSAYAILQCMGTQTCAEKIYSQTINMPTTEIGCY